MTLQKLKVSSQPLAHNSEAHACCELPESCLCGCLRRLRVVLSLPSALAAEGNGLRLPPSPDAGACLLLPPAFLAPPGKLKVPRKRALYSRYREAAHTSTKRTDTLFPATLTPLFSPAPYRCQPARLGCSFRSPPRKRVSFHVPLARRCGCGCHCSSDLSIL